MAKRIFLFIVTNLLVLTTIFIILSVLGIGNYIDSDGNLMLGTLLAFSAVVGFTGAFISLLMSRWMAKKMMNVRVLHPDDPGLTPTEHSIVEKVHRLSRAAGMTYMPEVGIYDSPEVNAFATGPSKKRSLVAVSTGLIELMDDDALEGVIAHEVAHIANGDMVTMTLLQGVVNTFVVFLSRIAAFIAARFVRSELQGVVHFIAILVFQILFSILGSIVVLAYSRYREYHADAGGAHFAGKDKMIHALRSLQNYKNHVDTSQQSLATLKINNKKSLISLFSSHPDLEDRIARLQNS